MVHLGVNRFFRATVVALVVFLQVTAEQYHASGLLDVKGPESSCEESYSLEGSLCVKIIQEKSKPFCSLGYLKDGLCVEEYPSVYTCPPQYKLRKGSASAFVQKAFTQHNKFKHPVVQEPQCSRTIVEAPIPRCPIDYEFDGMSCQKVISVDPVCPSGSEQTDEGTCTYYKPISSRCPEGYSPDVKKYLKPLNERKCMKVSEVFAKPVCNDGYSFTGEHCEMLKVIPPTCPKGSKEVEHNKCAYYKKAAKRCPPGFPPLFSRYTLKKECSKEVTAKSYPVCLNGYELDASQRCRKVDYLPLVCPRNTKEIDGNCVNYTSPSSVCPPDFVTSHEGMCVKSVASIKTCSPDYELVDNACVKIVSTPPVCPPGAVEDSEHECAVFYRSRRKCPHDFERIMGKCIKVMNLDPLVTCTKGFTLTGGNRCEKKVMIQPDTICRKGSRKGRDCVEYISVPLQYECPTDYEKIGNRCTRIVEYDCSTVEYETKCIDQIQEYKECNSKECEMNYSRLINRLSSFTSNRTSLFNTNYAFPLNESVCEKVVSGKKQLRCKKRLYADAMSFCPSHSEAEGERCVVAKKSSPDFVCKDEFDLQGSQCVRTLTKDPVYKCPDNYVMIPHSGFNLFPTTESSRRKCYKMEEREPSSSCEKGEIVNNRCISYFSKKCPNDNCERRVVAPVNYGCDVGFDHVSGRAENATCVSRETVSPSLVCDRGVVEPDSGRCVYFNDKVCPPGGCEKISTMIPKQKCPSGFKGSKNCVATETAAVDYYCSEGEGVLEGEHCVSFVDKQCPGGQCTRKGFSSVDFKCPNGFSLRNAALIPYSPAFRLENASAVKKNVPTCILNELSDMEKYCREGEMSFGDRCVIYVDKECPNGGDCRITYTLDPAYDCPEGYKIPVPYKRNGRTIIDPCQKTIVIPAKMSCRKGFESKSGKCMKTTKVQHVCASEKATVATDGTCNLKVYEKPKQIH